MSRELQKHRIKAFNATLDKIETDLQRKILFIEHFAEVYKFPLSVARNNLRQYRRQLKAARALKNFKT
jgi:hypothetical protein